ncbi:MAG: dimethyl sulfoxide reductase anchor subunit [Alphaproteobacteria bacterium]|nr:dimethyl sulfoxide reductase anchor subunit [Alphaproteobacteria bacterium]
MHPAYSVIYFTVASGAGYGLLFLLGLQAAFDLLPAHPWSAPASGLFALALVTTGLLSSTLHLGHKLRAWRAVTQWRSSWLSREGVLALIGLPVAVAFLYGMAFQNDAGWWRALGLAVAMLSALTVHATAMIYASLKPIRHWNNPLTVPVYLLLALASGGVADLAIDAAFGDVTLASGLLGLALLAAGIAVKRGYWRSVDAGEAPSSPESATGLGAIGRVRLLERPHTEENYLLKEMGYQVARRHARRLRLVAQVLGFLVPALALAAALMLSGGVLAALALFLALAAMLAGLLVERWLFFAEAKHTVTLYYGAGRV